jgi:HAD superfamily hydrolase (TIGR01509 family)
MTEPAQEPWPRAVLWDLDGTLVETEPAWMAAEYALAERHGSTWSDEDALSLVGHDLRESGEFIRERMGLELEPSAIVEELLDGVIASLSERVPWRPGALELLGELERAGVRCGLVTMSYRRFVQPILEALPVGHFEVVVTGDEVTRGKPHPEPYLRALTALELRPAEVLVLEDSDTGARSAEAAGCPVLVVPSAVPVDPGPRRTVQAGLEGIDLARLRALPHRVGDDIITVR